AVDEHTVGAEPPAQLVEVVARGVRDHERRTRSSEESFAQDPRTRHDRELEVASEPEPLAGAGEPRGHLELAIALGTRRARADEDDVGERADRLEHAKVRFVVDRPRAAVVARRSAVDGGDEVGTNAAR